MPPKRKKSVRQKQKQRQSQSQKVIVNVGKTTPRKRRTTGRGKLPPPSYQQNLFPPTIIQQQAPNIAVLENQISRLTSLIQPTQLQNLNTPLSTNVQASNTQVQQMAGQKAEERRTGPTAGNFQPQASKADFDLPDPLTGGMSDISTLSGPSLQVGFNEDETIQAKEALDFIKALPDDDESAQTTKADESLEDQQAEAFKQQILKQKKEKEFGGSSLPPSNTIKQDDTALKKSPPQSKLAEEPPQDFTPMTNEQLKLFKQLQKKGSLTPEEQKTKKELRELGKKSGKIRIVAVPKSKKASSSSSDEETEKQKESMRMARQFGEDFGRD